MLQCGSLWACRSAIFKGLVYSTLKQWTFCTMSTFTYGTLSTFCYFKWPIFWCQYFCTFTQVQFEFRNVTCNGVGYFYIAVFYFLRGFRIHSKPELLQRKGIDPSSYQLALLSALFLFHHYRLTIYSSTVLLYNTTMLVTIKNV